MKHDLIGWARVSTKDQSLDLQKERLKEAGCCTVFGGKHSGVSKANDEELESMIKKAEKGDTIIVTKLDRLGRSLSQVLSVVDRLTDKGVGLKALDQPIDTSNDDAMGKAMMQLLGMFAEMEKNMIFERTMAGREATGNWGGRSNKLDEDTRRKVWREHQSGVSKNKLSKQYGVSRSTVLNICKEFE